MFHLLISLLLLLPNFNTTKAVRLEQHAKQLKTIAERDSFNTDIAILVDYSIPSKNYRYFVINLHDNSILLKGLCSHGGGHKAYDENVVFSNVPGSELTSEGKYLIGSAFYGKFGLSYKLYGIDESNSNALKRGIVLHAWKNIVDEENGKPTSLSNGCPMVSQNIFNRTAALIERSELPILMWIYK